MLLRDHERWPFKIHTGYEEVAAVSVQKQKVSHFFSLQKTRWTVNYCHQTKFVLRSDDDQVIDVHHLPHFLSHYVDDNQRFYLCHHFAGTKPHRNVNSKWYVSTEEYAEDMYPDYCCGWAYVTNVATLNTILEVSANASYFWIDDLFVTGTLVRQSKKAIQIYDWRYNFLSDHVQMQPEILEGKFFSPELMVASDISAVDIRKVWKNMQKCHKVSCYMQVYENPQLKEMLRPALVSQIKNKDEL